MSKRIKILVVEDERIVAEDIKKSLHYIGYDVVGTAASSDEVFAILKRDIPDLILMDVVIQGDNDGIETATLIDEEYDIPVVYLTAYSDQHTLERAKLTTPYGYLLKPFEPTELQTTIEIALYRYEMEHRLKIREEWFATTLKSIGDGVITVDTNGRITFMNNSAAQLTEWQIVEAHGRKIEEVVQFWDEKNNTVIHMPVEQMLKEQPDSFLSPGICLAAKNGSKIPVEYNCSLIRNDKKQVQGSVLVLRDVTERRRAEEAIQHRLAFEDLVTQISTRFINLAFKEADQGIRDSLKMIGEYANVDRSYVIHYLDETETAVCSHEWHAEGVPSLIDAVSAENDSVFRWFFAKSVKKRYIYSMQSADTEEDAKAFSQMLHHQNIFSFISVPLNIGKQVVGVLCFDSTDRKKEWSEDVVALLRIVGEIIVNALERQKNFLALTKAERDKAIILDNVSEQVIFKDQANKIIWLNKSAADSVGRNPDDLVGESCDLLWEARGSENSVCPMNQCLNNEDVCEKEIHTRDDKYWIVRGNKVKDENGRMIGVVEVVSEITGRKKAEMERASMESQLLQAQKMEAIGTLTGGVAHDFNNLLTAIQGCTDMALLRIEPDTPVYYDLNEVRNASERAAELTRQLLLFSRKHPSNIVPMNLNQTIDDLLKMLHRLIGEDVGIHTALEPDLWTVKADKGSIEQVLMNLSVNARDAMSGGGRLTIKTMNVHLDDAYCRSIPESRPGKFVRLTVSDTGHGMDKDTIEHIFEPFFSTKGPGRGTGLGLSVVYGIVKQHEGWINVKSILKSGTTFEVMLPAVDEVPEAQRKRKVSVNDLRGKGEKILLVEDAEGVREFAKMALTEHGYQVVPAFTTKEAIERFKEEKGVFDLLFSDVVLPDISGLDLIEELHHQNKKMKILLTSGYTDQKSQWPLIQERGYQFLQKPYTLEQLLQSIRNVLEGR